MRMVTIQIKVPVDWREKVKKMARLKDMTIQNYFKHLIAMEEEKERNGR